MANGSKINSQTRRFIANQVVRRLQVPDDDVSNVMAYVSALGADPRKQGRSLPADELDRLWPQVDRLELLSDLSIRRLCVTVEAGVGKTITLRQLQYVTQQRHPDHLAVMINLAEIPPRHRMLLDDDYELQGVKVKPLLVELVHASLKLPSGENGNSLTQPAPAFDAIKDWLPQLARHSRLTLIVDGTDQSSLNDAERQAIVLTEFLKHYPTVRCVIAGRPYSIGRLKKALGLNDLTIDDAGRTKPVWQFCQVERFSSNQVTEYLGAELAKTTRKLEADQQFLPRTLNIVRGMTPYEMSQMLTASDLYFYSIYSSLNETLERVEDPELNRWNAERILPIISAVAFAMWSWKKSPVLQVPPSADIDDSVDKFLRWMKSSGLESRLAEEVDDFPGLRQSLIALSKINVESIKLFPYLDQHNSLESLQFSDATVRDFLAAYWCARYLRHEDLDDQIPELKLLSPRMAMVWVFPEEASYGPDFHELWKLLVGLPTTLPLSGLPRHIIDDRAWVLAVSLLFQRNDRSNLPRPTELIYRAWPGVLYRLKLVGKQRRTYDEKRIESLSLAYQQHVRSQAVRYFQTLPRDADDLATAFLSEYESFRRNGDSEVARLEASFTKERDGLGVVKPLIHPIPAGWFLYGDGRSWGSRKPQPQQIKAPYVLSCFPVWNTLYDCFDPHHRSRFDGYEKLSPYPRGACVHKNWYDAWVMALWCHSRLPSDLEWEAGCRGHVVQVRSELVGVSQSMFWFGDDDLQHPKRLQNYAWFYENSSASEDGNEYGRHAHTVGLKEPEPTYGLYDMHGNVSEYTRGWWNESGRTHSCRGGSYNDLADSASCSFSGGFIPLSCNDLGIRLTRASEKTP